jgi:hypothetical protein
MRMPDDDTRPTGGSAFDRFQSTRTDYEAFKEQTKSADEKAAAEAAVRAMDRVHKVEPVALPKSPNEVPAAFDPKDWTKVPGLVGEFAEWIISTAPYPSRVMSLGTSLATMSVLMGQHVETPSGKGAQLYININAPTGFGKDDCLGAGESGLTAAGAEALVGPPDIFSSSGLIEEIVKRPLPVFCVFWDEFAGAIQRSMSGDNAWGRDLIFNLQKLFTCWQKNFRTPAAAKKASVPIWSPFVTVCGFSQPATFYSVCSQALSSAGFLGRLLNFEQKVKPPMCPENLEKSREVPEKLAGRLQALYQFSQAIEAKLLGNGKVAKMKWGAGAKQVWIDLAKKLGEEPDAQRREIFCRVAQIAERVASVIAFGRFSRVIEREDILLAAAIAMQSAEILYAGVLEYMEEELSLNSLCKRIVEWIRAAGGSMTRRDVLRKARPFIRKHIDAESSIAYLINSDLLREEVKTTGGRSSNVLWVV